MPKGKSPKVKVSICNTVISKINSNFNRDRGAGGLRGL